MDDHFDTQKAKEFLANRELQEREQREHERIAVLALTVDSLKKIFSDSNIEVYLVGSVTKPYSFHSHSDVDVVLKNFNGDRFDVWTKLETMIKRNVEIIIFEDCHFQEHVIKIGWKVV